MRRKNILAKKKADEEAKQAKKFLSALSRVLSQLTNVIDSEARTAEVVDYSEETENDIYRCLSIILSIDVQNCGKVVDLGLC
jgi:hypothetical protein